MTRPRRRKRTRVPGPLIASLAAFVLVMGLGWFVLRDPGSSLRTSEETPAGHDTSEVNDAWEVPSRSPSATRTPTASPTLRATRTPSATRKPSPTPTPKITRTPKPNRSTAAPTETPTTRRPSTSTPRPTPTTRKPEPTEEPPRSSEPPADTSGSPESEVLKLTNKERAKAGCGALKVDKSLTEAAEAHASDMVDQHYFAHESLDGSSPFDRMKAAGFTGGAMAENIAVGQRSAADVMEGWMDSPGHRANILNCAYTKLGVGFDGGTVLPDYGKGSWVQNFGG